MPLIISGFQQLIKRCQIHPMVATIVKVDPALRLTPSQPEDFLILLWKNRVQGFEASFGKGLEARWLGGVACRKKTVWTCPLGTGLKYLPVEPFRQPRHIHSPS